MNAWAPTLSGRIIDFADPQVDREMIRIDVARGLAVQARFTGQTDLPISIAQHCVIVADAILDETRDPELAAFGLLHDAHEFIFGDWTSPSVQAVIQAIDRRAEANGVRDLVREALALRWKTGIADVKRALDAAIVPAAGHSFPRFEAATDTIRRFDLRSLRSERDDLMGRQRRPWALIEDLPRLKTRGRIRAWPWMQAEERFRQTFDSLCPERVSAPPVSSSPGSSLAGTPATSLTAPAAA